MLRTFVPIVGEQAQKRIEHQKQQADVVKRGASVLPFRLPFIPRGSRVVKVLRHPCDPQQQQNADDGATSVLTLLGVGGSLQLAQVNIPPAPAAAAAAGDEDQAGDENQNTTSSNNTNNNNPRSLSVSVAGHTSFGAGSCVAAVDQLASSNGDTTAVVALQDGRLLTVSLRTAAADDSFAERSDDNVNNNNNNNNKNRRRQRADGGESARSFDLISTSVTSLVSPASASASPFFAHSSGMVSVTALSSPNRVAVVQEWDRSLRIVDLSTATTTICSNNTNSNLYSKIEAGFPLCASATALLPEQEQLVIATGGFMSLFDVRAGSSSSLRATSSSMLLADQITCVCAVPGRPNTIVTGCEDRSVTIWDTRKFTKQHVAQNVLKFIPASVTAAACAASSSGVGVAVAGSDSEARALFLPLPVSASSHNNTGGVDGGKKKKNGGGGDETNNKIHQGSTNVQGGTFRQRLQGAVHCGTSWHGGWDSVPASVGCISAAIGLSTECELFVASW